MCAVSLPYLPVTLSLPPTVTGLPPMCMDDAPGLVAQCTIV